MMGEILANLSWHGWVYLIGYVVCLIGLWCDYSGDTYYQGGGEINRFAAVFWALAWPLFFLIIGAAIWFRLSDDHKARGKSSHKGSEP